MLRRFVLLALIPFLFTSCISTQFEKETNALPDEFAWPEPTQANRPWTRWWWMGNAVDEPNLTILLTQYHEAGLGGVEICPIYGVKGYEDKFIDFLSPEWMKMLEHTTLIADKLGFGVDLTAGTGWPFGGPNVTEINGSESISLQSYTLEEGEQLSARIPRDRRNTLFYLLAISNEGQRIELTDKVTDNTLNWTAPAGQWKIYEIDVRTPVQRVKRAAPGGEGYVLDPYSTQAIEGYLADFDKAFENYNGKMPRAFFHDSFEYYGANWTSDFFEKFESLRGYDLRDNLEALFGEGPDDTVARVKCDYRQTLSDLHIAYVKHWTQWCNNYGSLSRNQAHGAPANLIDLYAATSIPETEIFRTVDGRQIPMLKFSSSAAHLKGTTISSSESFTWLREHFQASLADIKPATDFLFLSGVNHIFFHGIPYSPKQAPWPGWQFYASVNFGPGGPLWLELPAYNAYVTRCQSILQSGKPDNNILLYMPIFDFWHNTNNLTMPFTVHNQDQWLYPSSFYDAAMTLWNNGFTFEELSDSFLAKADCQNGKIILGQNEYDVIMVPRCTLIPVDTMNKLVQLADSGATILFDEVLPSDVPGLPDLDKRRIRLKEILDSMNFNSTSNPQIQQVSLNKGKIILGELEAMLQEADLPKESAVNSGIRFVRRKHDEGYHYLFVNRSDSPVDQWITLGRNAKSAVLMDPLFSDSMGLANLRSTNGSTQVYLQLKPGRSIVLRTFPNKQVKGPKWQYTHPKPDAVPIEGNWQVTFIAGGPNLPANFETNKLISWTELDDPNAKSLCGTARYKIEFNKPAQSADGWILDLGKVCDSARVTLNGQKLGTLWCEPFQRRLGKNLRSGTNILEIEVTNIAANRIRDMDRRGVNWKYFYDINVVNVDYRPFDASDWPLRDSGLLGPVRLIPQEKL